MITKIKGFLIWLRNKLPKRRSKYITVPDKPKKSDGWSTIDNRHM